MNILPRDSKLLISLLLISFISVYFMPRFVNQVVFLVILFASWRTNLNYVYLVWFFILSDAPGRLFSATAAAGARLPLYNLTAGVSFSFQDLFLLVYILKVFTGLRYDFVFRKEFQVYITFLAVIFLYSFIYEQSYSSLIVSFRVYVLPWAFLLIVPAFIQDRQTANRVVRLLLPVVFFALASQLYAYATGNYFDSVLRGQSYDRLVSLTEDTISRAASSGFIILFVIIFASHQYFTLKPVIKKNYLSAVLFVSFFSVLLTASRGWILAFILFFVGLLYLYSGGKLITNIFRIIAVSVVILMLLTLQFPALQRQVEGSIERLMTVELLAKGDVTAGGTLERINIRGPRVLNKFLENPVLGWGFSQTFFDYADGHVGHHNILLNVGIIGFFYLNFLFFRLAYKLRQLKGIYFPYDKSFLILFFGMLSVYLIHSSSTQFWGFAMMFAQLPKVLFFSFFFAMANALVLDASYNQVRKKESSGL